MLVLACASWNQAVIVMLAFELPSKHACNRAYLPAPEPKSTRWLVLSMGIWCLLHSSKIWNRSPGATLPSMPDSPPPPPALSYMGMQLHVWINHCQATLHTFAQLQYAPFSPHIDGGHCQRPSCRPMLGKLVCCAAHCPPHPLASTLGWQQRCHGV